MYVHFPYCITKCPYCDFLSVPTNGGAIPHRAYADAVLAELERRAPSLGALPIHSIFVGGGTPSLWEASELGRVVSAIRARFPAAPGGVEVTVECNPGSFDRTVASAFLDAGVTRISLGVQSLDRERLRFLGRAHDEHQGLEAIATAREAGFTNVSADLIFGVSGQTAAQAASEAARVADAGVSHLSAYALTIEAGTRFGELARSGRLPLLPDETVAEAFQSVREALEGRGLAHYEISNYAREGAKARHNLGYWRGEPYLGLGVGAWGTLPTGPHKLRYRNTPALDRYLRIARDHAGTPLDAEGELVAVVEPITPEVDLSERLMLGLRLDEGVDLDGLERDLGAAPSPRRRRGIAKWAARGALDSNAGRLRLTQAHWLFADAVIRDLL